MRKSISIKIEMNDEECWVEGSIWCEPRTQYEPGGLIDLEIETVDFESFGSLDLETKEAVIQLAYDALDMGHFELSDFHDFWNEDY